MIVVLSDLHFTESQSTQIGERRFTRNLSPDIYRAYFSEINLYAKANQIEKVDLVLAGDILEITRSPIWLDGALRPYVNNSDIEPSSDLEQKILRIVDTISREEQVAKTLEIFRNIHDLIEVEVHLHFMVGNHDRLVNATPNIRFAVREMFGLRGGTEPFPHYLIFKESDGSSFCLVRHGHEYDPTNFPWDLRKFITIPADIPQEVYEKSTLGDITTIEFGGALPWLFRQEYGDEAILEDPTLLAIYERLMEFDDVRPTSAWLSYLLTMPGVDTKVTWHYIRPAFTKIINILSVHEDFNNTLKQSAAIGFLPRVTLLSLLRSPLFKKGIPYWVIKWIMRFVSKTINLQSQAVWAKREALIQNEKSGCRCVVSGHTHIAEVSLISAKDGMEKYYLNTGTWRNVIPATKSFKDFGRLKALTKVMIFSPNEEVPGDENLKWAFRHMSGVSYGHHRMF